VTSAQSSMACLIVSTESLCYTIRHFLLSATTTAATSAALTTAAAAAAAAVDRRGRGRGKPRGLASLPYGGLSRTGGHKLLIERTAFCTAVLTLTTATASSAAVYSGATTAGVTVGITAATANGVTAAGGAASVATDHVQSCSSHSNSSSQYNLCTRLPAASVGSTAAAVAADNDDILLSYFMAAAPRTTAASAAAEKYNGSTADSTAVTAHYTLYAALIGQRLQQRLTGVHERTAKDALWSCMRSVIETTVSAATATVNSVTDATDSSSTGLHDCACATDAQQQQQCVSSSTRHSCSSSNSSLKHNCSNSNSNSSSSSSRSNNCTSSSSTGSDCEWQCRLQHVVRLLLCTCTALKPLLGLGSRALVKLAALMFEGLRDCTLPDAGEATIAHACPRLLISTCRAYYELYCRVVAATLIRYS
jgi:hypothetical protein